jgi:FAD/FMN-containing dehydrogenase
MGSTEASDYMLHPEAIVFCQNNDSVLSVIDFANCCDYKLSVCSGGHTYAGYSSCEEGTPCIIQLDMMSSFLQFSHQGVGSNVVTLGIGLTIGDMHTLLVPLGLTIPMGICKSVGIGGHFQSSALGLLSCSFGYGMDCVTSIQIVTSQGTILDVSRDLHWDLYSAVLLGGWELCCGP